jgi:hypothetical protein
MLLRRAVATTICALIACFTVVFAQDRCEQLFAIPGSPKKKMIDGRSEWPIGSSELKTSSGCMRLSASLNSPEMKSLQLTIDGPQRIFRRGGQVVDEYPDQVELVVEIWSCFETDGSLSRMPPEVDHLHFKFGSAGNHPVGVNADFTREAWTELSPAHRWYRMTIPTKGLNLSQTIEIHFGSVDLPESCLSGRL